MLALGSEKFGRGADLSESMIGSKVGGVGERERNAEDSVSVSVSVSSSAGLDIFTGLLDWL